MSCVNAKKRGAMIPGSPSPWQALRWQDSLKRLVTRPADLAGHLQFSHTRQLDITQGATSFPLRIPLEYLQRIPTRDPDHPFLKQFIPSSQELDTTRNFDKDPVGEIHQNPVPGLIHKYKGRVLLIISSSCPIHCRYCFRRHFPYGDNRNNRDDWHQALDYIREDASIREVIYSGGDPLSASDDLLGWLTRELASIPHLKRLRVHTRYPIVLPQRITQGCLDWLSGSRLLSTMVVHCNHPDELDDSLMPTFLLLKQAGITLLNQSVLLRGVNDNLATLINLSETLHRHGVLPYYLHLLDKVQGAAHFEVPEQEALILYRQLQAELPGYLLPKLVREQAGEAAKSLRY